MKNDNHKDIYIDKLVRGAFEKPTPPAIHSDLRKQMCMFARELEEESNSTHHFSWFGTLEWWNSTQGKIAFAVLSAFILIMFYTVQVTMPGHAFASSLDAIRVTKETRDSINAAQSMRCDFVYDLSGKDKTPSFVLFWNKQQHILLLTHSPDSSAYNTIFEMRGETVIRNSIEEFAAMSDDSSRIVNQASNILTDFCSPDRIIEHLLGAWKNTLSNNAKNNESLKFKYVNPEKMGIYKIQIDQESFLPVELNNYYDRAQAQDVMDIAYWQIRFKWDTPLNIELSNMEVIQ